MDTKKFTKYFTFYLHSIWDGAQLNHTTVQKPKVGCKKINDTLKVWHLERKNKNLSLALPSIARYVTAMANTVCTIETLMKLL